MSNCNCRIGECECEECVYLQDRNAELCRLEKKCGGLKNIKTLVEINKIMNDLVEDGDIFTIKIWVSDYHDYKYLANARKDGRQRSFKGNDLPGAVMSGAIIRLIESLNSEEEEE